MGLNFIPKYPDLTSTPPPAVRESIEDAFFQDELFSQHPGMRGDGDSPIWWILGLVICALPWILGIAVISAG
jgi:hypothetical protein